MRKLLIVVVLFLSSQAFAHYCCYSQDVSDWYYYCETIAPDTDGTDYKARDIWWQELFPNDSGSSHGHYWESGGWEQRYNLGSPCAMYAGVVEYVLEN